MNKKYSWVLFIVYAIAMYFLLTRPHKPEAKILPADQTYIQVQNQEKAAGDDEKKLQDVVNEYNKNFGPASFFIFSTPYGKTEYGPKARMEIGKIQAEKLKDHSKGYPAAISTFESLPADCIDPDTGKTAGDFVKEVGQKYDAMNAHHWQYKVLDSLVKATGKNPKYSYALALLFITIVFKLATTPLSQLQFKYMREMQRIQPMIKAIQEKYKNDQKVMSEKVMQLYKDEGVNPFASCLPLLVQLPIMWLLFSMVRQYQYQFSFGHFLWIGSSLSHKFPGIIAANLASPDMLLLVFYTISMFVTQKLTPVDPTQAEQQKIMAYSMPIMFAFICYKFQSAFMLYWFCFNVVSTLHQYYVLRKPMEKKNGSPGPTGGSAIDENETVELKRPPTSPGKSQRRKKRFSKVETERQTLTSYPTPVMRPQETG